MSIFQGLTKEFKVGTLAVVSLTILILGYNFMLGKDNPLQRGREFYVYFDSTKGLTPGTSVVYNGFRVGQLKSLTMVDDGSKIQAVVEISSDINIPQDSKFKIESELLGGQKLKLVRGRSKDLAEDGDTLLAMYTPDQLTAMNDRIVPLVSKADSLVGSLNAFFTNPHLNQALVELPKAIVALKSALNQIETLTVNVTPQLQSTINNLSHFSNQLVKYDKQIDGTLKSIERLGKQMDTVDLGRAINELTRTTEDVSKLMSSITSGKGTLGKLATDDKLYTDLQKGTAELNRVLLDLKKYPEKYVPVPFTKSQRNKAKKESKKDKQVWPDSVSQVTN